MTSIKPLPNVVLSNLMYSGSSGVDPVLRELLSRMDYYFTPFGPEGTGRLRDEVVGKHEPFYHWTHDGPNTFLPWLGDENFKFIFLHRDPRDVVVSWAYDFQHQNTCPGMSLRDLMHMVITHNLPPNLSKVSQWVGTSCLVVKFDEYKLNPHSFFTRIINFLGFDPFTGNLTNGSDLEESSNKSLDKVIQKHSFENVAGRERGQLGEMIRTGYILRKGISGEWRTHFDDELMSLADQYLGSQITKLGYQEGGNI